MGIDWTKPLELVDGRAVTFLKFNFNGDSVVHVDNDDQPKRVFSASGKHCFKELPDIRNRAEKRREWSDSICEGSSGEQVRSDSKPFIVMEYPDGSLHELRAKPAPKPPLCATSSPWRRWHCGS